MQKNRRIPLEILFSLVVIVIGLSGSLTTTQATENKYQEGLRLLRTNQPEKARVQFEDYISEKPSAQRLFDVGKAYAKYGNWQKAAQYYEQVTKQLPNSAQAWVELGLAQYENKKTDDALDALTTAKRLARKDSRPYIVLANIYEKIRNYYEARVVYQDMLKLKIENAFAASRLCHLFSIESYYDEALKFCKTAVDLDPNDMNASVTLGKTLVDKGRRQEGLFQLARAATHFKNEAMPYRVRGMIYLADGNYTMARKDLGVALGLDANDAESAGGLGQAFFESGLYDQALVAYTEAAHLDKKMINELARRARMLSIKRETKAYAMYNERLNQLQ